MRGNGKLFRFQIITKHHFIHTEYIKIKNSLNIYSDVCLYVCVYGSVSAEMVLKSEHIRSVCKNHPGGQSVPFVTVCQSDRIDNTTRDI